MKERPILFSAPMVRAILAGTKTQTRRVVKPVPSTLVDGFYLPFKDEPNNWHGFGGDLIHWYGSCPYGQSGDRLWCRETWMPDPPCDGTWGYTAWAGCREGQIAAVPEQFRKPEFCNYRASWPHKEDGMRWTPAIHMPRWASRITLEVTGVRVERLNSISEADADAECFGGDYPGKVLPEIFPGPPDRWSHLSMAQCYGRLWESINGPGSWDANPWVWCVAFRRLETAC